jgi:hypothetical protein
MNRVVFLETNMPPELQGQSVQDLNDARIPGSAAVETSCMNTRRSTARN